MVRPRPAGDPGRAEDHEDPYIAVRDAFLAARRQLEDYVHKMRDQRPAEAGH